MSDTSIDMDDLKGMLPSEIIGMIESRDEQISVLTAGLDVARQERDALVAAGWLASGYLYSGNHHTCYGCGIAIGQYSDDCEICDFVRLLHQLSGSDLAASPPAPTAEASKPWSEYPPATDETICSACGERGHWWCKPSRLRFMGRGVPTFHPSDFDDADDPRGAMAAEGVE